MSARRWRATSFRAKRNRNPKVARSQANEGPFKQVFPQANSGDSRVSLLIAGSILILLIQGAEISGSRAYLRSII